MTEQSIPAQAEPISIVLDPIHWQHRLIIKQLAPEGRVLTAGAFDSAIGTQQTVTIHGQEVDTYFLVEAEVARDGLAVLMTLDCYDAAAIAEAKASLPPKEGEYASSTLGDRRCVCGAPWTSYEVFLDGEWRNAMDNGQDGECSKQGGVETEEHHEQR